MEIYNLFNLNVNVKFFSGNELKELLIAAEVGNIDRMRNLIDATKQWDLTDQWMTKGDRKGRTPLHLGATYGYINVVEFIVNEIIDLLDNEEIKYNYMNIKDNKGRTPLFYAAAEGRVTVLEFLLEKGADMEVGTNENHYQPGSTPLMACAERNEIECFNILVEKGVNLLTTRDDGADAIYIAARYGHEDLIEGLFEYLTELEDTEKVQILATKETFKSRTPLLTASFHGHISLCKTFIANGASLDHQDEDGYTPLMYAASENHQELVKYFILQGANLRMKNRYGETALKCAMVNKRFEIAKLIKTFTNENEDENNEDNAKKKALLEAKKLGKKRKR